MNPENLHATLVVVGDRGVLILGRSGSGKSTLALELMAATSARLVADDRVLVDQTPDGRLVGRPPQELRGMVEITGIGIRHVSFEPAAVIDLVVDLVADASLERMPEPAFWRGLPLIRVPERSAPFARQRVASALSRLES